MINGREINRRSYFRSVIFYSSLTATDICDCNADVDDMGRDNNDKALKLFLFWSTMIDAVCGGEHNFSSESKQRNNLIT